MNELQILLDKRALDEMVFKLVFALDRRDWSGYGGVLTGDVVFEFTKKDLPAEGLSEPVSGRETIIAKAAAVMGGFDVTQHSVNNIFHDVITEDSARVYCYVTTEHFINKDGENQNVSCGASYDIKARRTPDGWKIAKLNINTFWFRGDTSLFDLAHKASD